MKQGSLREGIPSAASRRRQPAAILLDLDDTLLRYTAVVDGCWDELCHAYAPRLGCASAAALKQAVQQEAQWYWSDAERHRIGRLDMHAARRTIVRRACAHLGLDAARAADELAEAFTDLREARVELFDGAEAALCTFRDRGIRLGLLTNGHAQFQRRKLERFNLTGFFDVVLIESELGFGKPDRRVFERALTTLRLQPADAWMVGDNIEWEIVPAQALGIHDVWVDHAGTGVPADAPVQPTRIVASVAELSQLLAAP